MSRIKLAFILLMFTVSFAFWACEQQNNGVVMVKQSEPKETVDPYLEWNKSQVALEDEDIDFFTKRYGWKMRKTGTGLRIEILQEGIGEPIKSESVVTLKYTTLLLTGDTVYSSAKNGEKVFKVDKSDEIAGLHEAVKLMRKNGIANLVIPSFLAYGIAGDGSAIKGTHSLAMRIEVVDVKN